MSSIGDTVPDFTLEGTRGEEIREYTVSEFAAGRPTVLVFYVHDFSPVCTNQMCEVNDMELLTLNDDVAVIGISSDGVYSHREFIEDTGISYPLLADTNKELYEAFDLIDREGSGRVAKRGVVLLDERRTVQFRWESADNWAEWRMDPLYELHDHIEELLAGRGSE